LTFEQIGSLSHPVVEPNPSPVDITQLPNGTPQPTIGMRTFEEISATMSKLTGIPATNANVAQTYNTVKQQLPTVESIDTFLASHQTAVAQLAIEYCNALVEDTGLRASYFPGLNFSATANTYFASQGNRDLVINPLLTKMVGTTISTQPTEASIRTALEDTTVDPQSGLPYGLIPRLIAGPGPFASDRTATVTKAACAAILGSGTVLLQ
jgi:hypothetical protein